MQKIVFTWIVQHNLTNYFGISVSKLYLRVKTAKNTINVFKMSSFLVVSHLIKLLIYYFQILLQNIMILKWQKI